jgi:hypothetical protein
MLQVEENPKLIRDPERLLALTAMPAPVELLMQVWPGAQEIPLRQSTPSGIMVGMALTPQRRASANTRIVEVVIWRF